MKGCGRLVGPFECCTIVHGDSMLLLREVPDGYFKLVITDPPYGVGLEYDNYKDSRENLSKLVSHTMPEILRISPLVLITPGITNLHLYPECDWIMCWYYKNGHYPGPWGFNCWQPILCYGKEPHLQNCLGSRPDVIDIPSGTSINSIHPCPKPTKIWKHLLLRMFPTKTDNSIIRVLDPFSGTGTTARVAKELGLHFLCFEQSQKYYEESVYLYNNSTRELFTDE